MMCDRLQNLLIEGSTSLVHLILQLPSGIFWCQIGVHALCNPLLLGSHTEKRDGIMSGKKTGLDLEAAVGVLDPTVRQLIYA